MVILSAPLMAGNDLRTMPDSVKEILTAKEVIAINQDSRGLQGYKVFDDGDHEVYNKPLLFKTGLSCSCSELILVYRFRH
ncbi:MAG: hypothetical protein JEZ07_11495 [Phycisphaerae bacterium]|nr:hypothetical protein [Phycisphaerae bacterium]